VVLQNVFVLKKEQKKEKMKFEKIKKSYNYFQRMNDYYTAILDDRKRLENENNDIRNELVLNIQKIKNLEEIIATKEQDYKNLEEIIATKEQDYKNLEKEFRNLDKINQNTLSKYNDIVNSHRWKIINKLLFGFNRKR